MTANKDSIGGEMPDSASAAGGAGFHVLVLFVSGTTPNSLRAIANTQRICGQRLPGRHQLTIVDLYQQPELAAREQIIAVPTLVRKQPLPSRRLVGDMAHADRLLELW